MTRTSVLIVGYGAFGRAVHAALSQRDDVSVSVFSRSPKEFDHPVAQTLSSLDSSDGVDYDIVLVAVPGSAVRDVLQRTRSWSDTTAFLSSVKGMDPETGWFPSDVIYQATRSDYIAVMSGASVADEMLRGRPVFLTLACANLTLGQELIDRIENKSLRLELTDDVRGLEISGVGKNIVAIGAGIADGLELGENFRSAFIARGIVELTAVADRCGGRGETIVSTGSLADVILSCSSPRTRNYSYGLAIGRGEPPPATLAEGKIAAVSFMQMLQAHAIESPYFSAIAAALVEPARLTGALDALARQ